MKWKDLGAFQWYGTLVLSSCVFYMRGAACSTLDYLHAGSRCRFLAGSTGWHSMLHLP